MADVRRDRLERELATDEPLGKPALGSLALHGGLALCLAVYSLAVGLFHHNEWGGSAAGGAIEVKLVSAALPLPADHPPNDNVLATETPSEAPAPPTPKEEKAADEDAIPMQGKQEKIKQPTPPKTQQHQPQEVADNHAQYGEEQAASMARQTQSQTATNGPVSITGGDFGSRFPGYVDGINRNVSQNWYRSEVDPHTAKGTRVYVVFTIHRDGTPSDVQIDRSSGNYTLDKSCQRAVQRVDTFGNLPSAYSQNTLKVSYYCEY